MADTSSRNKLSFVNKTSIDDLPGYRRRIRVTPSPGEVLSELEDDFHCMTVHLRHENGVVTDVQSEQERAPWTTCPGAIAVLEKSFKGAPLGRVPGTAQKKINCTHLYDLAVIGAAHALDPAPVVFDVVSADPIDGYREMILRQDGDTVMHWRESNGILTNPEEIAGLTTHTLNDWIASLEPKRQEYARILRWAARVAMGRFVPQNEDLNPLTLPLSCHTFQPGVVEHAGRAMQKRDFSSGEASPLDGRWVGAKLSAK
jgi:hypothetical protein